jgi:UDPglucose 6-dehydrogenase
MKQICVIGVGYVGLVTAACFADLGNSVVALDISQEKIEGLKRGELPIYEPGLGELVDRNVRAGRLSFTTSYAEGLANAEFVFIAVGTPSGVDGEADLQYVAAAAETIAKTMIAPLIGYRRLGGGYRPQIAASAHSFFGGILPGILARRFSD